jgi:two-component system sensor histidine kinase UhpB
MVFALSLLLGGTVACINASRSVQAEMRSALAVAQQTVGAGLAGLRQSDDPQRDLRRLVASFAGNRHLRVSLGRDRAEASPVEEKAALARVPDWFVRLIGVAPARVTMPFSLPGAAGEIAIETVPHNEVLEIWNEFADSLLILTLFSLPTVVLIYVVVGRALRPLDRLAQAFGSIGRGDYGVRLAGRLPAELAPLRDSFNEMAARLSGMAAENHRLNEQLLTLQEQERSELARDLHDEVGPFLFAINVDAANIARRLKEKRPAAIAGYARSITEAVGHLQAQVKGMLGRLRPIGLAEFGLAEAITNLVAFWRRREPAIQYRLEVAPEAEQLGELLGTTIYRIVQEALSNALRHSRPKAVSVAVRRLERWPAHQGAAWVVSVVDDGQGMAADRGAGYGLLGMSERVRALGGSLEVASTPGAGVAVTATLPCVRAPAETASAEP